MRTTSWSLLALSLLSTGCYASWEVKPRALAKLGYHAPDYALVDAEGGEPVRIDVDTELRISSRGPDPELRVKLESATVWTNDGELRLVGTRVGGGVLEVDFRSVSRVVARRYSAGRTAGVVVAMSLGLTAVVASAALILASGLPSRCHNTPIGTSCAVF